jgi:hypothetical protein
MTRIAVPKKMRDALLRRNAEVCCVCKVRNIGVNFHHIDGNSANTVEPNLAVLCVRDHDAHHRPDQYLPDAEVNHRELDAPAILAAKTGWESFVAEARKTKSGVLATATAYGTTELIHSMKVAFHWASGQLEFERTYHLHHGPPAKWADWAMEEVAWLGAGVTFVLIDGAMPVEHCPCCSAGLTRTVASGYARKLTSPTWNATSMCSICVNPTRASLVMLVSDDQGEAFTLALHRCGEFLHAETSTYQERLPILKKPSVRSQVTSIVEKALADWHPSTTIIGTGAEEAPAIIDDLVLPRHWEKASPERRSWLPK